MGKTKSVSRDLLSQLSVGWRQSALKVFCCNPGAKGTGSRFCLLSNLHTDIGKASLTHASSILKSATEKRQGRRTRLGPKFHFAFYTVITYFKAVRKSQ